MPSALEHGRPPLNLGQGLNHFTVVAAKELTSCIGEASSGRTPNSSEMDGGVQPRRYAYMTRGSRIRAKLTHRKSHHQLAWSRHARVHHLAGSVRRGYAAGALTEPPVPCEPHTRVPVCVADGRGRLASGHQPA